MRVLRADGHKRMPWKNGKGETVEIAVFPPDASVDDFDFRISMATVAEDGSFSLFKGVDRTLSVLSGDGITLCVDGHDPVDLMIDSEPHPFPADVATSARLLGAPITDLNVMTRRSRFSHEVIKVDPSQVRFLADTNTFIHCTGETLQFISDDRVEMLQMGDCANFAPGEQFILVKPKAGYIIRLFVAADQSSARRNR